MSVKKLFTAFFFFLALSAGVFAQQVESIARYNSKVNEDITNSKLFVHRVTLNSDSKIWGGLSKYQENADYYFEMRDGIAILKKIIITSSIANRTSYTDMLFDEQGNLAFGMYQRDIMATNEKPSRYYYFNKRLILVSRGDESFEEKDFTTEDVQGGIDMSQKADNFRKVFDAMARVQLPFSK